MNKEGYKQELYKLETPRGSYDIMLRAVQDEDISKKDLIELYTDNGRAIREYYKQLEENNKQLTIKELFIKELEGTSSSEKIMEILSRAVPSNLEPQELIEIQFVAIKQLKDMIVRY